MKWYLKCLKQYADFNGRARRKEFWMFYLFNLICYIVTNVLDIVLFGNIFVITCLYLLASFIPSLAVAIRRIHDSGASGCWILIFWSPIITIIWSPIIAIISVVVFIFLYLLAALIPRLGVTVRGIHDLSANDWIILICAILICTILSHDAISPIGLRISVFWLLLFFIAEGDHGDNRYGKNPKEKVIPMKYGDVLNVPTLLPPAILQFDKLKKIVGAFFLKCLEKCQMAQTKSKTF
ncbi:MAG: DUF805 domain-containing protein [Prevotellaceae bacterium]|jgi:uncharacterized membrane protein YhaH (DUF805 family)|nr:DUF805 domain-containing protein [Prevotellaceae bacterium]